VIDREVYETTDREGRVSEQEKWEKERKARETDFDDW